MRTLVDYQEFLEALIKSFSNSVHFQSSPDLKKIIKENTRMVAVINHATPLSWVPAMALLALKVIDAGGGDRKPRGIVDRWFYTNPFTKILAEYLSQSDHPQTFEEIVETFGKSEKTDLVIFPEGAYTFFGGVHDVQKFRSSRFVEIAIRCQAPILIVAHKGSESWSLPLQLPAEWGNFILPFSKFFGEKLLKSEPLNVPLMPQKMDLFSMNCELYWPNLKAADLAQDEETRRQQIEGEGQLIKNRMNEMLKAL